MGQQSRAHVFYGFMTGAIVGGGVVAYWENISEIIYKSYEASSSFFANISPAAINFMTVAGFILTVISAIPLALKFINLMRSRNDGVISTDPTPSSPNPRRNRNVSDTVTHQVIVNGVALSIPCKANDDLRSMIGAIMTIIRSRTIRAYYGFAMDYRRILMSAPIVLPELLVEDGGNSITAADRVEMPAGIFTASSLKGISLGRSSLETVLIIGRAIVGAMFPAPSCRRIVFGF